MQTGSTADLDAAIRAGAEALELTPVGNPQLAIHLANTGLALRIRYERTGHVRTLDNAITMSRLALQETPAGHPSKAACLTNLIAALSLRFEETGNLADVNEATELGRQAVAGASQAKERALCLSGLGIALLTRFWQVGDEIDLAQASHALRQAIELTAADDPNLARYQTMLGMAVEARFGRTALRADSEEAADWYAAAARSELATASARIQAARRAAALTAATTPGLAADLLDLAVRLLPQAAPRLLHRTDQQYALSQFAGLASDAAALVLETGGPDATSRALGLLELGRAVLHGQALDTRIDLIELHISHPALAAEFLRLRDELDAPQDAVLDAGLPAAAAGLAGTGRAGPVRRDRRRASEELAALLGRIRGLDGFGSFLLPPAPDQLTGQAHAGPVVVFNISRYRSDAILITRDAIASIGLPECGLDVCQRSRN